MSAPAALAMSKLIYPETEKSKTTAKDVQYMPPGTERNILEAASAGASTSIKLVAAIAANLIAFMGLLQFANATLIWFGHRVGIEKPQYPELTFQLICAYLLWPFALVMGIDIQDCHKVAELIGIKIFLTEFVSFAELSVLRSNRQEFLAYNGTVQYTGSDVILVGINKTLTGGFLTERSEVISTYALCGFSNIGSIGTMFGALGSLAPNRKGEMAEMALRALIAGNVACFMTACIAGLLYQGDISI